MRRFLRLVATFLSKLCLAALQVIITGVVVITCVMVILHFLGVQLPWPFELLDKFEDLGRFANILSCILY